VRNRIKALAGAALGVALLYWFAKDLDWAEVWRNVLGANWLLLTSALLLTMTTYYIRALRWRTLLAPVAPEVRLSNLFAATALGFTAVFLLGRSGEIVRPVALSSKEHVRPSASVATILIERILDMTTVVAIFAVDLLVYEPPLADAEIMVRVRWTGIALLTASLTGIYGLVRLRRHREGALAFLNRRLEPFGRRIRKAVVSLVGNFAEALSILHDARELVVVSGYSLLLWSICAVVNMLTVRAFGFSDMWLGAAVFVLGFGLVGSLVPTPGGAAGAFHVAAAGGLMLLGIQELDAKSVAIVLHLIVFGAALPYGLFYLARGGYSLSRLRAAVREDLTSLHDFGEPLPSEAIEDVEARTI
jgi:hypothetical protein